MLVVFVGGVCSTFTFGLTLILSSADLNQVLDQDVFVILGIIFFQ
jgi:hypothetical protein